MRPNTARVLSFIAFFLFFVFAGMAVFSVLDTIFTLNSCLDEVSKIRFLQATQTIFIIGLPPILTSIFRTKEKIHFLRFNRPKASFSYIYAALFMLSALPAINLLAEINQQMVFPPFLAGVERWMQEQELFLKDITQRVLSVESIGGLLANLLVIAALAAICEEIFFRGFVQKILERLMNAHAAIWITAIFFSAIHLQFYGFLPRFLVGLSFGYMLWWSKSLWLPILAHFINNLFGVASFYINQHFGFDIEGVAFMSPQNAIYGVFSLFISILMLFLIKKSNKRAVE